MGLGKCRVKSNHYFCTSLMRGRLCASVYDGKCMLVMKALLCTEACVNVSAHIHKQWRQGRVVTKQASGGVRGYERITPRLSLDTDKR